MQTRITTTPVSRTTWLMIAGILLIAANLRAPFTGVPPLLEQIQAAFLLSPAAAGMLTTLPLLAFFAVSPFSARLAGTIGLERALFLCLVLIASGIALRNYASMAALFGGTACIGAGIAIGNVLLPSLLKRDFPGKVGTLTSLYVLTMGIAAALLSSMAIPLANASSHGWRFSLGIMIILPVITMVLWLPQLRRPASKPVQAHSQADRPVWRALLSWQITFYLGINSLVYYIIIGWLPAILMDAGYSAAYAGSLHGLLQLASALPGLLMIPVINRSKDLSRVSYAVTTLMLAGLLGLWLMPAWAAGWIVVFGFGTGASIILGLTFVSIRANSPQQAASLSGMAQSIGYLLAASGPTAIGALYQSSGNWHSALGLCCALTFIMVLLSAPVGKSRYLFDQD